MADDITLNAGSGGPKIRALDDGTREHPAGLVEYPTGGSSGSYTFQVVDLTHGLPVVYQTGYVPGYNLSQYGGTAVGAANAVHVQPGTGAAFPVTDNGGSLTVDGTVAVTGTFWQATQPVSMAAAPTGAALDATLTGGNLIAKAVGDVAHDAADSGAPVKIGGKANSGSQSQVAAGDRVDLWCTQLGSPVTTPIGTNSIGDGASGAGFNNPSSGTAAGAVALMLQDGDGFWSRYRNNHEVTALASAARTASTNSSNLTNYNARGVVVVIDVTAIVAAPSITVTIKGRDTLSGQFSTILASAAITAVGTTKLVVYPGVAAAANSKADEPLPRVWRVEVAHGNANSITYSIGANYIL